jgi:hypothetical protein
MRGGIISDGKRKSRVQGLGTRDEGIGNRDWDVQPSLFPTLATRPRNAGPSAPFRYAQDDSSDRAPCSVNYLDTHPHPYFANKILVFNEMRPEYRCKIVKTKELFAKSSYQRSYGVF